MNYTFEVRQKVRFTAEAKRLYRGTTDNKVHEIKSVTLIPDDLTEDGSCPSQGIRGSRSFAMLLGVPPDQKTRDLAGHHQWIFLENDRRFSGKYFEPVA